MEKIYWKNAIGETLDLTSYANINTLEGKTGLFMPSFAISTSKLQPLEGEQFNGIEIKPRTINIPIVVTEKSYEALLETFRKLSSIFNPILGEGSLQIYEHLTGRQLYCRYNGGLEGTGIERDADSVPVVLQFIALDPYWYDLENTIITRSGTGLAQAFFPLFPLSFAGTGKGNFYTINIYGAPVYPIFKIYGKHTGITIENQSSNKKFIIPVAGIDTDEFIIDMRPLYKTVTRNGVNAWHLVSTVDNEHEMFSIEPGVNDIIVITPDMEFTTAVTMEYTWRYLTR